MRGHHAGLDYHRTMLQDVERVATYDRAIRALVKPGDVVLDLGAGTGLLAMLAARRGARVHAIECTPVALLARRLIAHNGLSDRITVHQADACELAPVEPVDWVLGEWMGRWIVDDGMLDAVVAAGDWLKPTGRFCPGQISMLLAPVGDFHFPMVDNFAEPLLGLDLSPALHEARGTCYGVNLDATALLAPPAVHTRFTPPRVPHHFDANLEWTATRSGRLQALAGWFEAQLAPGVVLNTQPGTHTHWGQYLLPLDATVQQGETVRMHVWLDGDDWRWEGTHGRGSSAVLYADHGLAQDAPWAADAQIAAALGQQGVEAYTAGDMPQAAEHFAAATAKLGPGDDELARALYENLGMALLQLGKREAAAAALERAVDGRGEDELSEALAHNRGQARRRQP